jgi:hypothetical protein
MIIYEGSVPFPAWRRFAAAIVPSAGLAASLSGQQPPVSSVPAANVRREPEVLAVILTEL